MPTDLTPETLDSHEGIARAATQGEWKSDPLALGLVGDISLLDGSCVAQAQPIPGRPTDRAANTRHIATFDPPTMLAYVARVRELEAENERLRAVAERFHKLVRTVNRNLEANGHYDKETTDG